MSLETLVDEIRRRGEADLAAVTEERATAEAKVVAARDQRIHDLQLQGERATEAEIARERAQHLAAGKLQARKLLYEAREARLSAAVQETRALLSDFTRTAEYPSVLRRMVTVATDALGKQLRVSGRAEDASLIAKVAGKTFDPTPQPILGGIVAETPDGSRRLNLSFDELLRLREDKVRELLA